MKKKVGVFLLVLLSAVILFSFTSKDALGENEDIILGQSCALSGPSGALGRAFMQGANTYFNEVNEKGGVKGHKIKLITMDDYYEPDYAVKNTLELIREKNVFAIFGEVGTPTSKAVIPIVSQYKIPFLMPFSGAKLLREPANKYIINMRSSYEHETQAIIEYLTEVQKKKNIAVFYQNDSYGYSGYNGVVKALEEKELALVAEGKYRRNTLLIESAINKILSKNPDSIVLIGAYKQCALFIQEVKKRTSDEIVFANISFVGSNELVKALDYKTQSVVISQVVPIASKLTNIKSESFVYTEGYLSAKLFVKAVENMKNPITRENFLESFATLGSNVLDPKLELNIKNDKFYGLNNVYITNYEDGVFKELMEYSNGTL